MHFLSDSAPITLHTDASDDRVCGYLFETVDGIDQPVALVRKLHDRFRSSTQVHWSVIQKKAHGKFHLRM